MVSGAGETRPITVRTLFMAFSLIMTVFPVIEAEATDKTPYISLYTLGPVDREWTDFAARLLHAAYGHPVDYRGELQAKEDFGPTPNGEYIARNVLLYLGAVPEDYGISKLVLTGYNLIRREDSKTTCMGLSHTVKGTAIISVYAAENDKTGKTLTYARVAKCLLHETGHTFGLHHCRQDLCYMSFNADLEEVDVTGFTLCPRCSGLLEDEAGLSYEIARECLISVLMGYGVVAGPGEESVLVPPLPDDLSYDTAGSEKIEIPPETE